MAEQTVAQQKPTAAPMLPRVHAAALTAFIKRAFEAAGLPGKRCGHPCRPHGRSRFARQRYPRRDPPPALSAPAESRRRQSASEYPHRAGEAGDRAGRRRQWHGSSGHALCRHDRDREGQACGRRLGGRAHEQPCGSGRALRHDAARPRHDRALSRGRQQQPSAALGLDRESARHQSHRHRDSGRGGAADRARHGADGGGLRQGPPQDAAWRGDAGRLDDRP